MTAPLRTGLAGPGAVLAAAIVWGTSGTAAAFIPQVSPLTVGALTLSLSGVFLAVTARRGVVRLLSERAARPLLLVSAAALAGYILAFFAGMALAGVALGTVVALASSPLFVQAIESAVERTRPGRGWVIASSITLLGVVLLVGGRVDSAAVSWVGVMLAFVAGFAYAIFTVGTSRLLRPSGTHPRGRPDRAVIGAVQLLTVAPLLAVAAFAGMPDAGDIPAWGVLLYIGLIPTAIGYLLYARGLARVSAATAALLTLLEPVVAALLAAVLLAETLPPVSWVGIALTLVGIAAAALRPMRPLRSVG